jgi:hypothetical protein
MSLRVSLKVFEKDGQTWVVGGVVGTANSPIMTVILIGENGAHKMEWMHVDQYNAIEYRWFEDQGPAPHQSAVKPTAVKL